MKKQESTEGKELLLIFTRNPELGKVKNRLAEKIGDKAALKIYNHLLQHTVEITKKLQVVKWVFYSEEIPQEDIWNNNTFSKKLQQGKDLGERMENAFRSGFEAGFSNIIIIGSDLYDLSEEDLKKAFLTLDGNHYVLGPAQDGGYYLLGMKRVTPQLFFNKDWSTDKVFQQSLEDLKQEKVKLLPVRNDIDTFEDMQPHADLIRLIDKREEL